MNEMTTPRLRVEVPLEQHVDRIRRSWKPRIFALPGQIRVIPVRSVTPIRDAWEKAGGLAFDDPLSVAVRWEAASWELQREGSAHGADRCYRRAVEALSEGLYRLDQASSSIEPHPPSPTRTPIGVLHADGHGEWPQAHRGAWK